MTNNFSNDKCKNFTIYTEDFCMNFGDCNKGCCCTGCDAFSKLWEWIADKNPDKKRFIEF